MTRLLLLSVDLLFVGHCASDHLVDHFNTFLKDLGLGNEYLIQVVMDGPTVNLSFKKKVRLSMETNNKTSFLNIAICSLHPVHTAFGKGIKKLGFDVDEIAIWCGV